MNKRIIVLLAVYASSLPLQAQSSVSVYNSMPGIDCVINPSLVIDISSPVSGVIEELYINRSQQVVAGQQLVQLEASVDRANVDLARYRANVDSGIGLGSVNVNFDKLRMERVEGLLDDQNVSKEIVDQIERDVQLSKWNLKQAKELAEIRRFELLKAEKQLSQKSINAPFDGFVLDTYKNRGEYVDDHAILRMAQLDPLVVEAIVPMENFGRIKAGMFADIMPEVLPEEKLKAEVIAVDRIGDTASSTFGVKLSIPNPDNRIPAGLKCILKFIEPTSTASADNVKQVTEIKASFKHDSPLISLIDKPETITADTTTQPEDISEEAVELAAAMPIVVDDSVEESTQKPTSYMVFIKQPSTQQATQRLVEGLNNAGISDLRKFSNGPEKSFISLGVYSKRTNAERRLQTVNDLGFTAHTLELF